MFGNDHFVFAYSASTQSLRGGGGCFINCLDILINSVVLFCLLWMDGTGVCLRG